jgi:hypothetical protein
MTFADGTAELPSSNKKEVGMFGGIGPPEVNVLIIWLKFHPYMFCA